MPTYLEQKNRRIAQFAEYLRLMCRRAHKVVKTSCFIIFEDSPPEGAEPSELKESVAITVDALAGGSASDGHTGCDVQPSGLGGEGLRYIQFAFMRDCFYLELTNNAFFPREIEQLIHQRHGFYWAKSRTDLRWVRANWEDIVKWNPLQKIYLYRDEESAAEDMAYVLYQIWNFPVETPLYVTAASFSGQHGFEHGKRID